MACRRSELSPLVALLLALATACGGGAAPAPAFAPEPAIEIATMDAEVWAFERRVEGTAPERCRAVVLLREREGEGQGEPVIARRAGTRFEAIVPLESGENLVRARCEGEGSESAPVRLEVRIPDRPRAVLRAVIDDRGIALDLDASTPAEGRPAPVVGSRFHEGAANPAALSSAEGAPLDGVAGPRVVLQVPPIDGEYVVHGEVHDALGRRDRAALRFVVSEGRARAVDVRSEHARWIDDAVIYGAVPFLFGAPGLPAITARLDALDALGVDAVWLAPINRSPDDDYGYAVTDYFDVRDAYGTIDDLRALVDAAHARGMRVLMDFVPNHTSSQHPYFQHAERYGERSPYYAFYDRDDEGEPTHYFDWENLPNLDYENPEVRRFMREAFAFWARELDVDGFRIDAAWGIEQRTPEFFRELADELYRIDPQLLLVAEASARDAYWREVGFAAAYDWTEEIGHWAWREALGQLPPGTEDDDHEERIDVPALRDAILASERAAAVRIVRFLDNNDTGVRFVTRQGPRAFEAASTLLFALPGLPALFTGEELGAELSPYEREEPLEWVAAEDAPARRLAQLAAMRRELHALTRGSLEMLPVEPADAVIAFVRRAPEHPTALVLVELGGAARRARVTLPADVQRGLAPRDRVTGESIAMIRRAGELVVPLEAYGARVLVTAR